MAQVTGAPILLVHLARPNPVWTALQARPAVLLSAVDDYAIIPSTWRARAGGPDENGVPTSYYAAVQFSCRAEIVDEPEAKADLLRQQLAHFQPSGDHAEVAVGQPPYGRMLAGIRGLRLHVTSVRAKFKYDDHNPERHRAAVAGRLDARATGRDTSAAREQRRRLQQVGQWRKPRHPTSL
jgi:transcriptional regulator